MSWDTIILNQAVIKVENEPLVIEDFDADAFQKLFDDKVESFDTM